MSKPVPSPRYESVHGIWHVTTEGDCEGRSVKDLGVWEGYIDDIAFQLADQCYYSLKFKAVDLSALTKTIPSLRKEVNVSFDIDSNTWDLASVDLGGLASDLFRDRPVTVQDSRYHASFTLVRDVDEKAVEKQIREAKRQAALAKLSDEELELLGL